MSRIQIDDLPIDALLADAEMRDVRGGAVSRNETITVALTRTESAIELYDFPGEYAMRFDGIDC